MKKKISKDTKPAVKKKKDGKMKQLIKPKPAVKKKKDDEMKQLIKPKPAVKKKKDDEMKQLIKPKPAVKKKKDGNMKQLMPSILKTGNETKIFFDWLNTHFEDNPETGIPRDEIYSAFEKHCKKINKPPECREIFGKLVAQNFREIHKRRLGGRTDMSYYYCGLDVARSSCHYQRLSKYRINTQINRTFRTVKKISYNKTNAKTKTTPPDDVKDMNLLDKPADSTENGSERLAIKVKCDRSAAKKHSNKPEKSRENISRSLRAKSNTVTCNKKSDNYNNDHKLENLGKNVSGRVNAKTRLNSAKGKEEPDNRRHLTVLPIQESKVIPVDQKYADSVRLSEHPVISASCRDKSATFTLLRQSHGLQECEVDVSQKLDTAAKSLLDNPSEISKVAIENDSKLSTTYSTQKSDALPKTSDIDGRRRSRRKLATDHPGFGAQRRKAANCKCGDCGLKIRKKKSKVWRMCEILASPELRSSLRFAIETSLAENRTQQNTIKKKFVLNRVEMERQVNISENLNNNNSPERSNMKNNNSPVPGNVNPNISPLAGNVNNNNSPVQGNVCNNNSPVPSKVNNDNPQPSKLCPQTVYTQSLNSLLKQDSVGSPCVHVVGSLSAMPMPQGTCAPPTSMTSDQFSPGKENHELAPSQMDVSVTPSVLPVTNQVLSSCSSTVPEATMCLKSKPIRQTYDDYDAIYYRMNCIDSIDVEPPTDIFNVTEDPAFRKSSHMSNSSEHYCEITHMDLAPESGNGSSSVTKVHPVRKQKDPDRRSEQLDIKSCSAHKAEPSKVVENIHQGEPPKHFEHIHRKKRQKVMATQQEEPPSAANQQEEPPSAAIQQEEPPSAATQQVEPTSAATQQEEPPSAATQQGEPPSAVCSIPADSSIRQEVDASESEEVVNKVFSKVWRFLPAVLKDRHRDKVKQWLCEEFEWSPPCCLPRQTVYAYYVEFCRKNLNCTAPPAILGKLLLEEFKSLEMRRLGGRSSSKYYYMGLDVRPSSSGYEKLQAEKIITSPKPKLSRAFNGLKRKK